MGGVTHEGVCGGGVTHEGVCVGGVTHEGVCVHRVHMSTHCPSGQMVLHVSVE